MIGNTLNNNQKESSNTDRAHSAGKEGGERSEFKLGGSGGCKCQPQPNLCAKRT